MPAKCGRTAGQGGWDQPLLNNPTPAPPSHTSILLLQLLHCVPPTRARAAVAIATPAITPAFTLAVAASGGADGAKGTARGPCIGGCH
eukprot:359318-Chlamydomonas_euryale.AAC.4